MKKNYLQKLLALSLAATMVVGMAACGSKEVEESKKDETKKEESKKEESKEEEVKEEEQEITTVKILAITQAISDELGIEDWEDFYYGQVMQEQLAEIGLALEVEFIDRDSFANVVQTRMSTGTDLPDLISYIWPNGRDEQADAIAWAQAGLIQPLNGLLEQYDEDGSIMKFYNEKCPSAYGANVLEDGNLYWFSYLYEEVKEQADGTQVKPVEPFPLSIRKDWVEAVGETMKECYTPYEIRDLLVKFQENDVNGNGVKDEVIGVSIDHFYNGFAAAFGLLENNLLAGYHMEEGKVFSNFEHENFKEYIEFMNSLYELGVYDTAVMSSEGEMRNANKLSGYRYYCVNGYELDMVDAGNPCYVPVYMNETGNLEDGVKMVIQGLVGATYGKFMIPTASENAEAVIRLMDYVYSDDFVNFVYYGIEDYEYGYELNEFGFPQRKQVPEGTDPRDYYTMWDLLFAQFVLPLTRVATSYAPTYEETIDEMVTRRTGSPTEFAIPADTFLKDFQYNKMDEVVNLTETDPYELAIATVDEQAKLEGKIETLQTYAKELLTALILGEKSVDDLDTYVAEMNEMGLQDYIDVMQARYDRAHAN